MTNFELFCEKCKHTEYFYCQIVLTDYTLHLIKSDIQKLLSIKEDDVFYFTGYFQDFWLNKEGEIEHGSFYEEMSSDSKYSYKTKNRTPMSYGISIVHILFRKGVEVNLIEPFIPQLFESYTDKWTENSRKNSLRHWRDEIFSWETERDLHASLSDDDKVLFKKMEDLIFEFDWMIPVESATSGEGQFCVIVWDTIQIVRNGGGIDEVINRLAKHGSLNVDSWQTEEEAIEARQKHYIEIADKIIKLINEDNKA